MKKYIALLSIIICLACGLYISLGYRKLYGKKIQKDLKEAFIKAIDNPDILDEVILEAARRSQDDEFFEKLLNIRDRHGWNILMSYIVDGDIQAMKKLFKLIETYYVDDAQDMYNFLSATDNDNRTALFLAVQRKSHAMVEIILEKMEKYFKDYPELYAKIVHKHEDNNHWTPLLMAAYNDHYSCVEILITSAARILGENSKEFDSFINAQDNFGDNAFNYAKSYGRRLLQQYGAEVESALTRQAY